MANNASSRKLKVLHIVESFSTGVYSIIRDISWGLDPAEFHVHIIHSLRDDSPEQYKEDFQSEHITLEYIPMGGFRDYLKAVKDIRRSLRKYAPDIIHLHSSKAGFLGRVAAKLEKQSNIFYSPHGFSFLRQDAIWISRKLFFLLEKFICRFAGGRIVAVSKGELDEAKRLTRDTCLIRNFIDLSTLPESQEKTFPVVITSGRISEQKNPVLFNRIASQFPDITFRWVGDGPLRGKLTAVNVEVTGYLPRYEVINQVASSWLYIQTSKWEGMPVSVLEALGVGKPVAATKIIGNRDVIDHGVTGFLYQLNDVKGFTDTIHELIGSASLREQIGAAAKAYMADNHDISRAIQEYAEMYRKHS